MIRGEKVIVHGDGTSIWTLTHNTDFARGFVGLLGNSHAIGEVFHITSDEWLTWNQIYEILAKAAGVKADIVHVPSELINAYDAGWGAGLLGDKTHSFMLDNSKIKQVVPDFKCLVPFSRGAEEIIAWHMASASRRTVSMDFNALCDRIIEAYQKAWPE
jgi:nucleoside-diphosphate-sugar epimerase